MPQAYLFMMNYVLFNGLANLFKQKMNNNRMLLTMVDTRYRQIYDVNSQMPQINLQNAYNVQQILNLSNTLQHLHADLIFRGTFFCSGIVIIYSMQFVYISI